MTNPRNTGPTSTTEQVVRRAAAIQDRDDFLAFVNDPLTIASLPDQGRESAVERMLIEGLRFATADNVLCWGHAMGEYLRDIGGLDGRDDLRTVALDIMRSFDLSGMECYDIMAIARTYADCFRDRQRARELVEYALPHASDEFAFREILEVAAVSIADADLIDEVLRTAVWCHKSTEFCLAICSAVKSLVGDQETVARWFQHAVIAATDWRGQYCAVAYARHALSDPRLAEIAYEHRPWLHDAGFNMDHDFNQYYCRDSTMVVLRPSGAYAQGPAGGPLALDGTLGEFLAHEAEGKDAASHLVVFLQSGNYRGGITCHARTTTIVGIAGRTRTTIELSDEEFIYQEGRDLQLRGVTVRHSRDRESNFPSIACRGPVELHIEDCEISSSRGLAVGALDEMCEYIAIERTAFSGCDAGIAATAGRICIQDTCFASIAGPAIIHGGAGRLEVENCCFVGGTDCAFLDGDGFRGDVELRGLLFVADNPIAAETMASDLIRYGELLERNGVRALQEMYCVAADDLARASGGDDAANSTRIARDLVAKGVLARGHVS